MKTLRHPNIVKLVGVVWDETMYACALEYVDNGTLEDWLRKTTRRPRSAKKADQNKLDEELEAEAELSESEQALRMSVYEGYSFSRTKSSTRRNVKNKKGAYPELSMSDQETFRLAKLFITAASKEVQGVDPAEAGWAEQLSREGGPFSEGVRSWSRFKDGCGEAITYADVEANVENIAGHILCHETLGPIELVSCGNHARVLYVGGRARQCRERALSQGRSFYLR